MKNKTIFSILRVVAKFISIYRWLKPVRQEFLMVTEIMSVTQSPERAVIVHESLLKPVTKETSTKSLFNAGKH